MEINFKKLQYKWLYLLFAFLYLILRLNFPVSIWTIAGHDDALFFNLGQNISQGHWLGAYNQVTLAKGPFFPLFLAINSITGIPITLTIGAMVILSSYLVVYSLNILNVNKYLVFTIYILLLFHPGNMMDRIIRDNIYGALSIVLFFYIFIFLINIKFNKYKISNSILLGFIFFCFWYTREEGLWIIPALVLEITILILYLNLQFINFLKKIAISLLFFIGLSLSLGLLNYIYYNKFVIVDFKDGYYSKTLKILNNVYDVHDTQYVSVSKEKRERLYAVSPSFKTLEAFLNGPGKWWIGPGCQHYKTEDVCNDYSTGWFMWAIRDGADKLGFYKDAYTADKFYQNIYSEIQSACDAGTLTCKNSPIPFIPYLKKFDFYDFSKTILKSIYFSNLMLTIDDSIFSMEPIPRLISIREFLNRPSNLPSPGESVDSIYIRLPYEVNKISIDCSERRLNKLKEGHSTQIFQVYLKDFNISECVLLVNGKNISISSIFDSSINSSDGVIDGIKYGNKTHHKSIKIENFIKQFYIYTSIWIFIIGLISIFLSSLINLYNKRINLIYILSISSFAVYFLRILFLSFVEYTSFPIFSIVYFTSAFPFIPIFSLLALQSLLNVKK